jgi:putative transposase
MMNPDPLDRDDLAILLLGVGAWMNRELTTLVEFLNAQLQALMSAIPTIPRLGDEHRHRLAVLAKRIDTARLDACAQVVTVETLRRWYRALVIRKWSHPRTGAGRPPLPPETVAMILTMARENPGWGSPGISQRLRLLKLPASASTIRRVLVDHGLDPAPVRERTHDWQTYLESHARDIAALDFTTVECFDHGRLTTQYCLFAIHHDTRAVQFLGMTEHPNESWMTQQARNLTAAGGFASDRKFMLMDRDASLSQRFRHLLALGGIQVVRIPPQSPNCNPFIERFFRSLKDECLSRIIPLSIAGLASTIREYLDYYHYERPHQGLDGNIIRMVGQSFPAEGQIECRKRLGGILRYYYRKSA